MSDPFKSWTPEQVAQLPDAPDVLGQWEAARANHSDYDCLLACMDAGDAMAAELARTRAMVITLEKSDAELRGLVERALVSDWGDTGTEWAADADRILAPDTEADE